MALKFSIIAVGRLKTDYARLGCERFLTRLRRYHPVEHVEVRDVRRRKNRSVEQYRAEEEEAILSKIQSGSLTVALDERGRQWTSVELATWVESQKLNSVSHINFLIGGPDGLSDSLRARAHRVWSLGQLTLPHEMARLLLFEQLYRASSLNAGHPYHRE